MGPCQGPQDARWSSRCRPCMLAPGRAQHRWLRPTRGGRLASWPVRIPASWPAPHDGQSAGCDVNVPGSEDGVGGGSAAPPHSTGVAKAVAALRVRLHGAVSEVG